VSTAGAGDWFAIVDTARDAELHPLVMQSAEKTCLFAGKIDPVLAAASPWLVRMKRGEPLSEAWSGPGAGQSWGILCQSPLKLEDVRKHFRRFLQAMLPDGTRALFRFYDPRVFHPYIRAALPEERAPWFGDVTGYAVEDATGGHHFYALRDGVLFDGDRPV
jgi:hypothetical protein